MCAACGPGQVHGFIPAAPPEAPEPVTTVDTAPTDAPTKTEDPAKTDAPAKFAALKNKDCRTYLGGTFLSMMADNIEHVITYWVLWQTFHSPALAGFQVISHFVPFLLFSVYFGGLADRYDCRRVIQVAQVMFMSVSVAWGLLFWTGTLQIWNACVLLVIHGLAGTLWAPAEQLMLHDFVGTKELPSAVRLNSTARSLGILAGPAVGSVLLLGLGPRNGIFANVLVYLPLTIFLMRTRFTGHTRDSGQPVKRERLGLFDAIKVFRDVKDNPTIISLIALGGLGSFFIGVALQSTMPIFATSFGGGNGDGAYGVLLFANGLGGVIGGLLLEVTGRIKPNLRVATISTFLFGLSTAAFAATGNYALALLMLVVSGTANLASTSIGQTLVQLMAPPNKRGQVIGLYGMSANGLRFGSGLTVGVLGGLIGVHASLGISSLILCAGTLVVALYATIALRKKHDPEGVTDEHEHSLRAGEHPVR